MARRKSKEVWEFGDFQTPESLAGAVCRALKLMGIQPAHILEPTCGRGYFLAAAADAFPAADLVGLDINSRHLAAARDRLAHQVDTGRVELQEGDFFKLDWGSVLKRRPGAWLILGNPPWVTSAELGALASANLPAKSNVHGRSGIEAMTGKSNFDISEWMLLRYLDWLRECGGWVAVLVKTAVARKLLVHTWKACYPATAAAIYAIDAMEHFGAGVDACLFVLTIGAGVPSFNCPVFESLIAATPSHTIGFHDGLLLADVDGYLRWRHLAGHEPHFIWRSGIKHDCSKVMELTTEYGQYRNGLGETVELEGSSLYPLLKSSDVNKNGHSRGRLMLVTQRNPGEDTAQIRLTAPLTWAYLQRHASALGKRGSAIYRNRPPFSIFGVGEYSFASWKVAISGFYKSLRFVPIGPVDERPTVFDDTVYFLPCHSQAEAEFLAFLLNSMPAQGFYHAMIFWADKRPITSELLKRLSIAKLAAELGKRDEYESFANQFAGGVCNASQLSMLELV